MLIVFAVLIIVQTVVTIAYQGSRRSRRQVIKGLTPITRAPLPDHPPAAEMKGGARIGGMNLSYPLATLKLYRNITSLDVVGCLAIVTDMTGPVVISIADISALHIKSIGLGCALSIDDREGRRYDCSFTCMSRTSLLDVLRQGGMSRFLK
jgi:hypothetical protein